MKELYISKGESCSEGNLPSNPKMEQDLKGVVRPEKIPSVKFSVTEEPEDIMAWTKKELERMKKNRSLGQKILNDVMRPVIDLCCCKLYTRLKRKPIQIDFADDIDYRLGQPDRRF